MRQFGFLLSLLILFSLFYSASVTVTLTSPSNHHLTNNSNGSFVFSIQAPGSGTYACSVLIDNIIRGTNTSVTKNTQIRINISNIADGNHTWFIACSDGALGNSSTRRLNIDTTPPTIIQNNPSNNYNSPNSTLQFNFTQIDSLSPTSNCSLLIDGAINQTNSSVLNNTLTSFTVTSLTNARHNWSARCTDAANNTAFSQIFNFSVDTITPAVTLLYPDNGFSSNTSTLTFRFNAADEAVSTLSCSLIFDSAVVQTNASVSQGVNTNFTLYNSSDGVHSWAVSCTDSALRSSQASNRSITVSTVSPPNFTSINITLNSPPNNYVFGSSNATFNITSVSAYSTVNCSLLIGGLVNQTNTSVLNNTLTTFSVSEIQQGIYNWSARCNFSTVSDASETRNFSIDTTIPNITLLSPADMFKSGSSNLNFSFRVVEPLHNNLSCHLLLNGVLSASNSTTLNNTVTNLSVSNITDGHYNWSVSCFDQYHDGVSALREIHVGTTPPVLSLHSPENEHYFFLNHSSEFSFTVFDEHVTTTSCSLYLNNSINQTNSSVPTNTPASFIIPRISDSYSWNITCTDPDFNHTGASETRSFQTGTEILVITILSPINLSTPSDPFVNFNFRALDPDGSNMTCGIFLNNQLQFINASISSNVSSNFTFYDLAYATSYSWYINCQDAELNTADSAVYLIYFPAPVETILTYEPQKSIDLKYSLSCPNRLDVTASSEGTELNEVLVSLFGKSPTLILLSRNLTNHGEIYFLLERYGVYELEGQKSGYKISSMLTLDFNQRTCPPQKTVLNESAGEKESSPVQKIVLIKEQEKTLTPEIPTDPKNEVFPQEPLKVETPSENPPLPKTGLFESLLESINSFLASLLKLFD